MHAHVFPLSVLSLPLIQSIYMYMYIVALLLQARQEGRGVPWPPEHLVLQSLPQNVAESHHHPIQRTVLELWRFCRSAHCTTAQVQVRYF